MKQKEFLEHIADKLDAIGIKSQIFNRAILIQHDGETAGEVQIDSRYATGSFSKKAIIMYLREPYRSGQRRTNKWIQLGKIGYEYKSMEEFSFTTLNLAQQDKVLAFARERIEAEKERRAQLIRADKAEKAELATINALKKKLPVAFESKNYRRNQLEQSANIGETGSIDVTIGVYSHDTEEKFWVDAKIDFRGISEEKTIELIETLKQFGLGKETK